MAQYLDKAALVAEINKRIMEAPINTIGHQRVWAYNDVKDILNTLEVKEVDLEKELKKRIGNVGECDRRLAVHFFELGLKAQKGE